MMMNTVSDWLFNVLLLGGIVTLLVLLVHVYAAPIVGTITVLAALGLVVVLSAFWPKW
jgi:hypothetical protein